MTASESSVKIGSLFIITCMGGTIGRAEDGSAPHDVPLDDIGCSKFHAKVACTGGKFLLSGWSNRILLRKLKYFICFLKDIFLFLV